MGYTSNMVLVDSHCHLEYKEGDSAAEEVIGRAQKNRVGFFLNIGTDIESSRKALEISKRFDSVFATAGIHPHDAKDATPEIYQDLKRLTREECVLAVGEVGLDYFYTHSPRETQIKVLTEFLSWHEDVNLPYVFHIRDAFSDFFEVIDSFPKGSVRGVTHCFTGTLEEAQGVLERGLYLSLTGILTFKKSQNLRDVVRELPLEKLMLETDSPFLAPEGYRSKTNEPSYLPIIAECLADLKGISVEEVARVTTANCHNLFGFPQAVG